MKLKIIDIAFHRNGICGVPFDVVLFENEANNRKVGIVFEQKGHCAVLAVDKLAAGDIAFGSNSWRGDHYESDLRKEIVKRHARGINERRHMNQESKKNTFNGWSNRETWAVNLWITNEQESYFRWRNRTKALLGESHTQDTIQSALATLADEIRDVIEEECAILKANLAADLMNGALAAVDWHEIAQAFLDEVEDAAPQASN